MESCLAVLPIWLVETDDPNVAVVWVRLYWVIIWEQAGWASG